MIFCAIIPDAVQFGGNALIIAKDFTRHGQRFPSPTVQLLLSTIYPSIRHSVRIIHNITSDSYEAMSRLVGL